MKLNEMVVLIKSLADKPRNIAAKEIYAKIPKECIKLAFYQYSIFRLRRLWPNIDMKDIAKTHTGE